MKIKNEYDIKCENGQNMIVSSDKSFSDYIVLSNTTTFLFKETRKKDCSKEELLNALLNNFDISVVLALSDLDVFIKLMKENDIFE